LWFCPLAIAGACLAQTDSRILREGKYWVETSSGKATAADIKQLRVSARGALTVQGENRRDIGYVLKKRAKAANEAAARLLLDRISVKTSFTGGVAVMEVAPASGWEPSADVQLSVPEYLREVALESLGESIEAYDLDGALRAGSRGGRLQGGRIRVEEADRGITVTANAGLIEVLKANGPVIAQTGAGAIDIRSAGNVQCQAGAGAIQLRSVCGGLRALTGSGDITVFIPSNLAVTVQASSAYPGNHRIVSGFSEIQPRLSHDDRQPEAQGAINGGGPLLRLTASGGTICLRRQK